MLFKIALGICPGPLEDFRVWSIVIGKLLQVLSTLRVDRLAPGDELSSKLAGSLSLIGSLKLIVRLRFLLVLVLLDRLRLVGGLCFLLLHKDCWIERR
jgi:hypothetical protein